MTDAPLDPEQVAEIRELSEGHSGRGTINNIVSLLRAASEVPALCATVEHLREQLALTEQLIGDVNFHLHGQHSGDESDCEHPYCRRRDALQAIEEAQDE